MLNVNIEEPTETDFTKWSYVPIELNGKQVLSLVYIGDMHNFVKEELEKWIKWKIESWLNSFKATNSKVEKVVVLAH